MMLIGAFVTFFCGSAFGMNIVNRRLNERQPENSVHVSHTDIEKFRELVGNDLASKADELIDMIVADVEKILNESHEAHPAFIQENFKEGTKKIIKNGVITILKHMLPLFESWIAEAVKPPVTTPMVYSALVKPIGKSIFEQIYTKFKLPITEVWEFKGEDDFDLELNDAQEEAELQY